MKKPKTKKSIIIGSILMGIAAIIATLIVYFVGDEDDRAINLLIAVVIPLVAWSTVVVPSWFVVQKEKE